LIDDTERVLGHVSRNSHQLNVVFQASKNRFYEEIKKDIVDNVELTMAGTAEKFSRVWSK